MLEPRQRRYQVATQNQPLELYIPQSRWLRIDEYQAGKLTHRYQWHPRPGPLKLWPPKGQPEALYRIFSRQARPLAAPALMPYPFPRPTLPAPQEAVEIDPRVAPQPPRFRWIPNGRLGGSAHSTDGAWLQFKSRLDLDNDASDRDNENFFELGWQHREKLDCQGCYWRSDLFARRHTRDSLNVLGTEQWLEGTWPETGWHWQLKQSLLIQTGQGTPWKWHTAATAINRHRINETLQHAHQLQVFGRYLSEDSPRFVVDNDIYSDYQDDHQWGIKLQETLLGRPWLDSLWTTRLSVMSNEDLNPFEPEYLQARVAWHQYWTPWTLSINYRHRTYLSDDDREQLAHRPVLGMQLKYLQGLAQGQLLQWLGRFDADLDRSKFSFMLEVSRHHARGRGLRDFRPQELIFLPLRARDMQLNTDHHYLIHGPFHD
jgi:hypothetical protein